MYNISVCKGCGRTMDTEFLYCPWCGYSRMAHNQIEDDSLEDLFARYEKLQKDTRRKHLQEMGRQLDELEKELNVLVLSAEMHK